MVHFEVSGTEKFRVLAEKLRAAEHDMPERLRRAVDEGARDLPAAARRSALTNLPHRGGLAALVARARITNRRVSSTELEVRAKGIEQLANTNEGYVNHPTFRHRPRVTQPIRKAKGWFFQPMRRGKSKVKDKLGEAMHRTAKEIT